MGPRWTRVHPCPHSRLFRFMEEAVWLWSSLSIAPDCLAGWRLSEIFHAASMNLQNKTHRWNNLAKLTVTILGPHSILNSFATEHELCGIAVSHVVSPWIRCM